jgi:hypothetical protein
MVPKKIVKSIKKPIKSSKVTKTDKTKVSKAIKSIKEPKEVKSKQIPTIKTEKEVKIDVLNSWAFTSPFINFCNIKRPELLDKNSKLSDVELGKMLSGMWLVLEDKEVSIIIMLLLL